jgi:hypothetical protein
MSSGQPSILVLMTDQQRWDSQGIYGCRWAHTPNLDRFGQDGVVFDNDYFTNPNPWFRERLAREGRRVLHRPTEAHFSHWADERTIRLYKLGLWHSEDRSAMEGGELYDMLEDARMTTDAPPVAMKDVKEEPA